MKFTTKALKSVKYNGVQERIFFSDIPDLGINIGARKLSFLFKYLSPVTGRRKTFTLIGLPYGSLPELNEIRALHLQASLDVAQGKCPMTEKRQARDKLRQQKQEERIKSVTLQNIWNNYRRHEMYIQLAPGTQSMYAKAWESRVGKWWSKTPVTDMNMPDVRQRLETLTNPLWNVTLSVLRRLEKRAMQLGHITAPFTYGIERKKTRVETHFLEGAELTRFLKWLYADHDDFPSYRAVLLMQLLTGTRNSEIRLLQWSEIQDGLLCIPPDRVKTERKSNPNVKPLLIPILPAVQEVLDKMRGFDPRFVFPQMRTAGAVTNGSLWVYLRKHGFHFSSHSLRRTTASISAEDERIDEFSLKLLLNHSLSGQTKSYTQSKMINRKIKAFSIWHDILKRYRDDD